MGAMLNCENLRAFTKHVSFQIAGNVYRGVIACGSNGLKGCHFDVCGERLRLKLQYHMKTIDIVCEIGEKSWACMFLNESWEKK